MGKQLIMITRMQLIALITRMEKKGGNKGKLIK